MALAHPFCAGLPILLAHFCALTHHYPYRIVKKYYMGKIYYFNSILLLQNQNFYYLYIAKRIQRLIEKQFSTDVL